MKKYALVIAAAIALVASAVLYFQSEDLQNLK